MFQVPPPLTIEIIIGENDGHLNIQNYMNFVSMVACIRY